MAQRKPYNLNTAYGRRKLREKVQEQFDELPPEKKAEHKTVVIIIGIVFFIVIWLILGTDNFSKWILHRK